MTRFLITLKTGDIALAFIALYAAMIIRFGEELHQGVFITFEQAGAVVATILFSSVVVEMYNQRQKITVRDLAMRIILGLTLSFFLLSALYYVLPATMYGRGILFLTLLIFGAFQFTWHLFFKRMDIMPGLAKKVLILGAGPLAKEIGTLVSANGQQFTLAGYYDPECEPVVVPRKEIVENGAGLFHTVEQLKPDHVVVSLPQRRGTFPLQDMLSCKISGVDIVDAPSFYEQVTGKLLLENITPSWFIFSDGFRINNLTRLFKRLLDVTSAGLGLLLTLPLFPVIALLIKLDSPGPVFFRQTRVGQRDEEFTLIKFRTMRQDAETVTGAVWAQQDDPRITKLGHILRKTRVDEIPQLINVVLGDMSLIGPRPERPEFVSELKKVIPYYSERHFVKPGVTGWAQVCYPYGSSVEDAVEKLRYDLYYIKNLSLLFDIRIILRTINVVLFQEGSR
ncbi:sugar transferase, PEP-CTERM system associated/exopolysaccharide biosynthesis polyprenyl glycosylphosphotransferase [Desulfonatronum thiosulfatophilum]|uniref:Sugar transferase, PEP-CTERM system associated/exopolysaccharide biosynthesis polyprenyl glycosylphosphotransferase n=1 Tax=Desulfonatronum thiosulfatophilum TaxID=617002 RepID=A0A1G6EKJ4_9BACT|nr:TIGR03013 family XrtA/PEP-CTERM system glycosyltransferase [Desulfonatronum thiosulfatophilum]SDB57910.1 sugar transferase, PEP-CTERM system associated/exopolysaccharide biosynthesis polyprenyl glycosylphosphotransferase [Desulfonatronum thiosulfatophilum]